MSVPKLRFKADNGSEFPEWEDTTLGQHGQVLMCRRIFKEQTSSTGDVPFYKIGTFGGTPDAFISKELFEEYKAKYPFPKVGNILISASGSIGRTVEYKGEEAYFQDSNIVWLDHGDDISDDFLKQFYSNVSWSGLEGSTIKRLYNKIILDTPINLPSISEQHKIADFFSTLDQIIKKTQAEVDAWEKQKQGMMQRLFSQEIRFKADDGSEYPEWEQKCLGEIAHQLSKSIDPQSYSDVVFTEYSMPAFDNGHADEMHGYEMKSTRKVLSGPCVLINKLNVRKKRIWIIEHPENNAVCSAEFIPVASEKMSLKFLGHYALTDSFTNYLLDCSSGSSNSQKRVTPDIIMNMTIPNPCIEEQRKIAACLSAFDSVIDKTKQELKAYKQLKRGLMQQMFV